MTPYAQIAKRLPSWLYKIFAQKWVDYRFPRHLFIETTATCNLSCSYCPREKVRQDMDFGLFCKIIDEASEYGARSFSLHLFGEPLLYPRIINACSYIKRKNKGHIILFTTNGTKLEAFYDDLRRIGIDKVFWSWRTEVKWSEAFKERLRKWKAFTVRLIEGTYPEGVGDQWPRVEGRRMHNYGGNIKTKEIVTGQRWPCYHLWLAPAVAWNGNFLMCCSDPHQKEVFGNVAKETVSEAWQRLERVRQSHLKGEYSGICKECDVWKAYPNIW